MTGRSPSSSCAGALPDGELRHRFLAERQILARLEHPHIARLFDAGATEDGQPYLVMEHVEGLPLDAYCDAHRLTVEERIRLFRKVCAAVQHAHRNLLDDPAVARTLVRLAGVRTEMQQPEEAEALFRQALAIDRQRGEKGAADAAQALTGLAALELLTRNIAMWLPSRTSRKPRSSRALLTLVH
jgi:hypothetical protein